MPLRQRLRRQLLSARQTSERLLSDFQSPQDWVFQVHSCANHALWFAGHMGHSDNFFISLIDPSRVRAAERYAELFGMGSQPVADPRNYPSVTEVQAYMRERRATLLELLDQTSDQQLDQPIADGAPDFLKDIGSVFEMAIWHEGLHSGQLSVVRRGLGFAPLN